MCLLISHTLSHIVFVNCTSFILHHYQHGLTLLFSYWYLFQSIVIYLFIVVHWILEIILQWLWCISWTTTFLLHCLLLACYLQCTKQHTATQNVHCYLLYISYRLHSKLCRIHLLFCKIYIVSGNTLNSFLRKIKIKSFISVSDYCNLKNLTLFYENNYTTQLT